MDFLFLFTGCSHLFLLLLLLLLLSFVRINILLPTSRRLSAVLLGVSNQQAANFAAVNNKFYNSILVGSFWLWLSGRRLQWAAIQLLLLLLFVVIVVAAERCCIFTVPAKKICNIINVFFVCGLVFCC